MAISRCTKARLQIVAVVAAIGAAVGIAISWLLSRIIDFPYDLPSSSRARATRWPSSISATP